MFHVKHLFVFFIARICGAAEFIPIEKKLKRPEGRSDSKFNRVVAS